MCMLDGRAMNAARLTRRIAEHVTQIGLEMRMVGDSRKLVRIGEIVCAGEAIAVRDWARYDAERDLWRLPASLSERAWERVRRFDPESADWLRGMRQEQPC